ncbi:hypothetical protein [Streptomyces sp. MUM 178J]|uniref:hypothetical protein n=1 Tax=Streptomyces sp. MUM 178J TaxID=2791991 RepID=UPI001F04384C|nr:hypothetical protein [Streptomyces sp. MUM 178J]WRQ80911.1 hypothetical protein I3F59_016970 [Streptomyces sp. MUM 178J]
MPLPFLTADRTFDADSSDAALPFDDHDQWRRPYRPGPWRVGMAALLLLLASFVFLAAMIVAFAGAMDGAAACLGVGLAITVVALRLLRMGVWVSRHGLRRVGFFATATLAWGRVEAVRTVQQPVRWLAMPRTVQGQALILVRRGGAGGAVPLLTDHNADFLSRTEAFDRAADAVEAWASEYR